MGELSKVLEIFDKPKTFFFDMDGVLAKWEADGDPHAEGFFESRKLEVKVRDLIRSLKDSGYRVVILSAVYTNGHAEKEKIEWLINKGLEDIPHLFVPYGSDKSEAVAKHAGHSQYILIDDFTQNLNQWRDAGHTAVKFLNGKNNTKGTWLLNGGMSISVEMTVEEMLKTLEEI